jgi:hypothetical protein
VVSLPWAEDSAGFLERKVGSSVRWRAEGPAGWLPKGIWMWDPVQGTTRSTGTAKTLAPASLVISKSIV